MAEKAKRIAVSKKADKKLLAFIVATGISPKTAFDEVIAELCFLFPGRRKVADFLDALRTFEAYVPYEQRIVGCFDGHRRFRKQLRAVDGAEVLSGYLRQWVGAEIFLWNSKIFKKLPAAYK